MDFLTFIYNVAACYIAGLLLLLLKFFIIDKNAPLKNYLGDIKLYNLTFIHIAAKQYERDGIRGDELVKRLQNTKYGFISSHERRLNEPSKRLSKKKKQEIEDSEQAYIFAMNILNNEELLKNYIIPDGFDEKVYQKLCEEIQGSEEQKAANTVIRDILVNKSRANIEIMVPLLAQWNTRPFIIDAADSVQSSLGRYQYFLYRCLKEELSIINCTQKQYISAMKILRDAYPKMEDIKEASTLSGYSKEYSKDNPDVVYIIKTIKKRLK